METAGAGDRETWLLETLVGMRVTVALGSRTPRRIQDLRGNDEGAARERRVMQRSPSAGKTRGDDVLWNRLEPDLVTSRDPTHG